MTYSGAVLAGGRSRRFGTDKARFIWRGKPLLAWVLEGLEGAAERFIVANRPYPEFGVPVQPDLLPGGDSLSGLHAALARARWDWVAVAACDLPYLTRAYWDHLYTEAQRGGVRVVAGVGPEGFPEPLAALYHRSLKEEVERRLRSGQLRLGRLLEGEGVRLVPWAVLEARFGPRLFTNANTPGDLGAV
ncbi:molybdenum cofactor guanylyltransferase [Marinithermus hydrothermalis]|uniref:Probable molybdenum cofactor guanylyltransferase n=1 Tax=Marinithermus hydrothermalis (strain DSM 14884 / JCM 11576 / T1) TaxID=869210 RepID=F2NNW1_MARHT|nr:molybdenum cofactor guanylyltransferase [Marinithermus hydrothermalis]AEB11335.1 Molybdopterin-guanine dinucleotide biosynthesis protein A [Marinithermus hydrothermalis DSM 14884]